MSFDGNGMRINVILSIRNDLERKLNESGLNTYGIGTFFLALDSKIPEITKSSYEDFVELLENLESSEEQIRFNALIKIGIKDTKAVLLQGQRDVTSLIADYLKVNLSLKCPEFIQKEGVNTSIIAKINRLFDFEIDLIRLAIYITLTSLERGVGDSYDFAIVITELKTKNYTLRLRKDATDAGISEEDFEKLLKKIGERLEKIAKPAKEELWRKDGIEYLKSKRESERYKGLTTLGIGPDLSAKLKNVMVGNEYFSTRIAKYIENVLEFKNFDLLKRDEVESVIIDNEIITPNLLEAKKIIEYLLQVPVAQLKEELLDAGYSESSVEKIILLIISMND